MTKFNWLHFGDLHWSAGDTERKFQNIEERLMDDIQYLNRKVGGIDLVICSGDIVFSGAQEQFEEASRLIKRVLEKISEDAPKPYFFAIPGNHDLVRPSSPEMPTLAYEGLIEESKHIWEPLWDEEETSTRKVISEAFSNYGEWYRKQSESHPKLSSIDPVFHDHSAVIYKEGYRIGLLGLNSTFLQLSGGDYSEKLAIDLRQVSNVCQEGLARWTSHNHLNFLVTHQPTSWLSKKSQEVMMSEVYSPPERFFAHLFGHMHNSSMSVLSVGGSKARRNFQTPSLFSEEPWGDPPRKERVHGYLVGQMKISEATAEFRMWPRLDMKLQSGGRTFSPDSAYDLVQDRPYTDWNSFDLLRSGTISRRDGDGFGDHNVEAQEDLVSEESQSSSGFILKDVFQKTYRDNPVHLQKLLSSTKLKTKLDWKLTHLQENFIRSIDEIASPYQDIIISGGTSSGKTTLSEAAFGMAKPHALDTARIIYLAPTRALAQERYREWNDVYSAAVTSDRYERPIIVSTGDDHADDSALQRGDFFVACLVYEKANVLFSSTPEFLRNINLVIVDELHMIEDWQRGTIVESILSKVSYEKERRAGALDQRNPLRVLGITTDTVNPTDVGSAFSYRDNSDFHVYPAVVVSAEVRPRSIDYSFVTMESTGETNFSVSKFRSFRADEPVRVSANEVGEYLTRFAQGREIEGEATKTKEGRATPKTKYTHAMRDFISDWLQRNPTGCRLLVFLHTKEISYELGAMTKNVLSNNRLTDAVPYSDSLQNIINGFYAPDLAANLTRLKSLFQQGVIVHNADLNRDLREKIEEHLKMSLPDHVQSEVIFATETLSYGVNLQIDDVLFGSLSFPSSQRKASEGFGLKRLSKNAFMNMAGRAGRINQGSKDPTVYVLINPHMEDSISGIIHDYFVEPSTFKSVLFHSRDGRAARDLEEETILVEAAAQELSYPFVRTVLDGLRFLGGMPGRAGALGRSGATGADVIKRYLARSLYWHQTDGNMSVHNLVELAVNATITSSTSEDFRLVSEHLGKPRITRLGASVIDTGTEIETVVPLRMALRQIFGLWSELFGERRQMPYELYLLPIIYQEESHRRFIGECPEVKFSGDWKAEANVEDLCERIADRLCSGELDGKNEVVATVLKRFRDWTVEHQPLNSTAANYELGAHDACLRLFLGLWDWTNGLSLSDVLSEMGKTYSSSDVREAEMAMNLGALAETLNWKILFTAELMNSMRSSSFDPVVSADAARLSLRVRLGCEEEAIPILFRRRSDESIVSRIEAKTILDSGHLCSDIVSGRADLSEFLDPSRSKALRLRITEFVNFQFREMSDTFTLAGGTSRFEEISDEYWRVATSNVRSLAASDSEEIKPIRSIIAFQDQSSEDGGQVSDDKQDVSVEIFGDDLKVIFGRKRAVEGTDVKIERYDAFALKATFLEDVGPVEPDIDLVLAIDFPWLIGQVEHSLSENVVRMSPASFGVLLSLMSRNLLSDNIQALQKIGEYSSVGFVSARQLMRIVSGFLKEDTPEVLMTSWAKYVEISEKH